LNRGFGWPARPGCKATWRLRFPFGLNWTERHSRDRERCERGPAGSPIRNWNRWFWDGVSIPPCEALRGCEPPTSQDNRSDLTRLLWALGKKWGFEEISVDSRVWRAAALCYCVKETAGHRNGGSDRMESQLGEHQRHGSRRPKLIKPQAAIRPRTHYSIRRPDLDVWTTSICGQASVI